MDLIRRGVEEIISEEELLKRLEKAEQTGNQLVVKLGCDPSRPDLHIGHAVVLRKLRNFQDLRHQSVLVVGDFTALIGDPSGRNKTRPHITPVEVEAYAETYIEQAGHILNLDNLKIVRNSDWLGAMNFHDVIKLSSHYTVARMLERDDFKKRYKSEVPISIHEFLYPLAQATDSVELHADVELGGTDQKFNLLVGRDLQRDYGQPPQIVITTPLLEGTDGVKKMSKTYDNYIGITDSPSEIYGRTMSITDELIFRYFEYATDVDVSVLNKVEAQLAGGEVNPRDLKRRLAREIVTLYHNAEAAMNAEAAFDRIFVEADIPDDMEEWSAGSGEIAILSMMCDSKLIPSKREARRLIEQGAVSVDGQRVSVITDTVDVSNGVVLKVGKRRFIRVTT
ncbi:MAG: tyrosine--tRNA ligase [Candidatus Neomarinimicrobiota bacterium]|nr:tyrosine--tRNA ligase [Candidatus Neomarinimicrobiota bacterium]